MQMILHTLNKPPSNTELSRQLSQVIGAEDSVLLIEDGVYHLLVHESSSSSQHWSGTAKQVYALLDDIEARGIGANICQATKISYQQFVELVTQHDRVINWY